MLTRWQAAVLGLVHGPAELLPISSSAHTELVGLLLGWETGHVDPADRKSFEVALHSGSLVGLLAVTPLPDADTAVLVTAPAAICGLLFERPIERRLGGPRATAAGLVAGSVVLVLCDALAGEARTAGEPSPAEALWLGLAQATALIPGLSRLGMTVAAARLLGRSRREAFTLGRQAGLPVIAAATALKGARALQRARTGAGDPSLGPLLATGAGAAAISSLACAPLARRTPVLGAALWRVALAAAVLRRRLRQNDRR